MTLLLDCVIVVSLAVFVLATISMQDRTSTQLAEMLRTMESCRKRAAEAESREAKLQAACKRELELAETLRKALIAEVARLAASVQT